MRLWLLGFMLVSGIATAAQSMYSMLSSGEYLPPLSVMQQIEKEFPGVIAEFEMEMQEGELVYQFELINPLANAITRFEYRARDGKLLKQKRVKSQPMMSARWKPHALSALSIKPSPALLQWRLRIIRPF